ncbi:MAG: afsK 2 [Schlesneria sp.]|nr:afsK 2 [Schlesneria sp.]
MRFFFLVWMIGFSVGTLQAGDWRQFRGTNGSSISTETGLPIKWSPTENIAWKVKLPGRGLSSPIVVGDRIFLTCSSGFRQDRLHVVCLNTTDGSVRWDRQFTATGRTMTFPKICNATPSPASDGQRVFALFSSNDLICLDLDGNLQWYRGLTYDHPNVSNSLGMASSPVVIGDTVVAQVENDSQSLATGIDVATGLSRWTIERPKRANWTSAVTLTKETGADDNLVLLQSSAGLAAIDPITGKAAWNYDAGASTIPSAVVSEGIIYLPSQGITALQPPKGSANPEVLWKGNKLGPGTASPIAYDGRLYTVNAAGVLIAADLKTGEEKWKLRLEGPFSGTPFVADGLLYIFNEKGVGQVIKPGDTSGEVVGSNDLGEMFLCTPAVSGGAIYIRSDSTLWKIAK